MQMAVIEFARNTLKIKNAGSSELDKKCYPVIGLLNEWNKDGKISNFKVMIRPYKAVQKVQEKMVEALENCIKASNNEIIKIALRNSISLVTQGEELSSTLETSKVIPKLLVSMVKIGEETGELSFMLENISNFYKREVEEAVSLLTKAMEPAIIFVVAAIVGTIVISLYLPMFGLINKMGN